jgi:DNA-binding CsgD family transcriptional regulator/PAS domain-containing protein
MPHVGAVAGNLSDLVGFVYEAAADASRWQAFLDAYAEAVGARRATLLLGNWNQNRAAAFRWSGWPDGDVGLVADRYRAEELYRAVGDGQSEGVIRTIDLFAPAETAGQSIVYRELYMPRDVRYGLAGIFLRSAESSSLIVAVRTEQDGPFGDPALAILRPLMPHLRQVALLQTELNSLRARLAAFTVYLDRSPFPFLLADAQGRVLYANAAANQTTSLKDGIAITSGHLSMMSPRSQAALVKAIEKVDTVRAGPLCQIEVERPSHKPPYRLILMPVPSPAALPLGLTQPAAAVLIVDTEAGPELDTQILGELFSLTPAEVRVTGKLGVGRSAEEIAQEMGLSLETVRTHIRHVLSKTTTGRQGELIALVLRTAPCRRL